MLRTLAIAVAFLLGVSPVHAQNVTIVTGGTGGVYYPLGGGLASLLSKSVPGANATIQISGGSIDNLRLVGTYKAELGLAVVDAAVDAVQGRDAFKQSLPIRAVAVLYPNILHIVAADRSGIATIKDFAGKRVSTGSPGSASELLSRRILDAAGFDPRTDIRQESLGLVESVNAMRDGKLDALFFLGGTPTAAITDLAATPGFKFRLVDHAHLVKGVNDKRGQPIYAPYVLPGGTYRGIDSANQASAVWNILFTHDRLDEALVYAVTKLVFERQQELVAVQREASHIRPEHQTVMHSGVLFHPGALTYFRERGWPSPATPPSAQPAPSVAVPPAATATPPAPPKPPAKAAEPRPSDPRPAPSLGRRVALVIGNSAYAHVSRLPNPRRDAEAIVQMLRRVGFAEVRSLMDATYAQLTSSLKSFGDLAEGADWAMVYFAGHGIEIGGTPYIIPVDAKLERDSHVRDESVALDRVLEKVASARQLRLVVLDACRNNPFAARMVRSTGFTRSVDRGLSRIEPDGDVLVAYAAKHGTVAEDGDGQNSPFVSAMLEQMQQPGVDIRIMFGRVRDAVRRATNNRQEPYLYGSVGGDSHMFVPVRH